MTPTRRLRVASAAADAPGPDDAQDRQVVAPPEGGEADGGRGVAGDDDRLDVALGERVERLRREREDLVVGADAVRRAGVVAEVDRRFGAASGG